LCDGKKRRSSKSKGKREDEDERRSPQKPLDFQDKERGLNLRKGGERKESKLYEGVGQGNCPIGGKRKKKGGKKIVEQGAPVFP